MQKVIRIKYLVNQQEFYKKCTDKTNISQEIECINKKKQQMSREINMWSTESLRLDTEIVNPIIHSMLLHQESYESLLKDKVSQKLELEVELAGLEAIQKSLKKNFDMLGNRNKISVFKDNFKKNLDDTLSRQIYAESVRNTWDINNFSRKAKK
ncbi:hypothetical protein GTG28_15420 [Vibrio sp. OCN044]|uniref:Uncharacterized protein n=1 Tax=Vibrio tetraodonis subsp. pristinus TaxID=2695891 RepID=A0A6L8LX05_9VIBR|nr:hypothetical protein [Vibrio tetraodonis]MYM60621.1 hypothetical protein [Vibrio tetraodonis subsp. pristinus]